MVNEAILVVDVGSANSKVALVADGVAKLLRNPSKAIDTWPTSIAREGEDFLIGSAAENDLGPSLHHGRFLYLLGYPDKQRIGELSLSGCELLGEYLRKVRARATALSDRPINRILLAIPDNSVPVLATPPAPRLRLGRAPRPVSEPARVPALAEHELIEKDVLAAANAAGFAADIELLPQSAAIAQYALAGRNLSRDGYLFVCDAGASSLRVSLVDVTEYPPLVRASRSIAGLGGDNLDLLLAAKLTQPSGSGGRSRTSAAEQQRPEAGQIDFARAVREALSDRPAFNGHTGLFQRVNYTAQDLRNLIRPQINVLRESCRELLTETSVPADRLLAVLLVGGGARAPYLADALTETLGRHVEHERRCDVACLDGGIDWAKRSAERCLLAPEPPPGIRPLKWPLTSGRAKFVTWLIDEGDHFDAGQRIGRTRDSNDEVLDLTPDFSGTLIQRCVEPGNRALPNMTLAVARVRVTSPGDLRTPPRFIRVLTDEARESVRFITFSPDGQLLVTVDRNGELRFHDTWTSEASTIGSHRRGSRVQVPEGRRNCAVARRSDGRWVAAVSDDKGTWVYDVVTGNQLSRGRPAEAVLISIDGTRVCTVAQQELSVRLTDGAEYFKVAVSAAGDPADTVAFSADGNWLAAVTKETIPNRYPWARKSVRFGLSVWNVTSGELVVDRDLPVDRDAEHQVKLTLSADGGRLLLSIGSVLDIRLLPSDEPAWTPGLPDLMMADFAAEGAILLTLIRTSDGGSVCLWDTMSGRPIPGLVVASEGYRWAKLSPDGRYLVVGGPGPTVIWALVP